MPLACENAASANPQGESLPTRCGGGSVVIGELKPTPSSPPTRTPGPPTPTRTPAPPTATREPTRTAPPHAELAIGSSTGAPGEAVLIDVTLADVEEGYEVAGIQNDIVFPPGAHVGIKEDGKPDCSVNPAIDKEATAFAFVPSACAFPGCTRMRALVLSLSNLDAIPPGSVLYACRWTVSGDARAGDIVPLACANAAAGDPDGNAIGLRCPDGEISVVAQTP